MRIEVTTIKENIIRKFLVKIPQIKGF